jgi:hypothetical protein
MESEAHNTAFEGYHVLSRDEIKEQLKDINFYLQFLSLASHEEFKVLDDSNSHPLSDLLL